MTHRDLRVEKCLIFDTGQLKIEDSFFSTKSAMISDTVDLGEVDERTYHVAPELKHSGFGDCLKTDIYSLGVILYYMITKTYAEDEYHVKYQAFEFEKGAYSDEL